MIIYKTANKTPEQDDKIWSILSMIATAIPIFLWLYCIIASKGDLNEGGAGVVWWLMVIYYWTFGLPLFVMSLVFGIKGLKTASYKLAIASIILKVVTIIGIVIAFIITI